MTERIQLLKIRSLLYKLKDELLCLEEFHALCEEEWVSSKLYNDIISNAESLIEHSNKEWKETKEYNILLLDIKLIDEALNNNEIEFLASKRTIALFKL